MKKILILILLIASYSSFAQITRKTDGSYKYGSEFIWAVQAASNSGIISGVSLRYGRKLTDNQLQNFSFELTHIKHPQEQRYHNSLGNSFIWGKSNYLVNLRMMYGREVILFNKAPHQGVQINGIAAGGINPAIAIPYYYQLFDGRIATIRDNNDPSAVVGPQGLFYGLSEASIRPALSFKTSLMFEYGTFKSNLTGFELGFICDVFFQRVILMEYARNPVIHPAFFINIIFGSRF